MRIHRPAFLASIVSGLLLGAALGYSYLANAAIGLGTCEPITNVALSTASEGVFAAYPGRHEATVTNNDASIAIYVARGATATTAWDRVPAGGSITYEVTGGRMWEGVISAIAASGTPAISGSQCR